MTAPAARRQVRAQSGTRARVVDAAGLTDRGRVRASNEDAFFVAALERRLAVYDHSPELELPAEESGAPAGLMLAVADGVASHGGGDVASRIAILSSALSVLRDMVWPSPRSIRDKAKLGVSEDLRRAAEIGDSEVRLAASQPGSAPLMASTLSLAVWIWPKLFVSHVGDSRCYLARGDSLLRLTTDHTVGERLRELDKTAADHAPVFDHMLWNAIGGGTQGVLPEVREVQLEPGDIVVLATDGLTKHVSDDHVRALLDPNRSAREMCRSLVDAANAAGGSDNVTAVVARSFAR